MEKVTRFGVSINPLLLRKFDVLLEKKGYKKRSDAISDLIRHFVKHNEKEEIYATINLYYNHKENEKIPIIEQEYPCLVISSTKVNIDNNNVIETIIIKGTANRISNFYKKIKSLDGIKNCILRYS